MKIVKDYYFKKAKNEGYSARSVYKLKEINQKYRLLKQGYQVLDLGCCPGSWMQYISSEIGPNGLVVGVDQTQLTMSLANNMRFIHSDIYKLEQDQFSEYASKFDLICSDMAPKTTGIKGVDTERSVQLCMQALYLASQSLKKGGSVLVKVLQGAAQDQLVKQMKDQFVSLKRMKPKSSRSESKEIFFIGTNQKQPTLSGSYDHNIECQK